MRATFFGCCASTTAPSKMNARAIAKIPAHFGFWILRRGSRQVLDLRLSEGESRSRIQGFCFMLVFSPIQNPKAVVSNVDPLKFTDVSWLSHLCFFTFCFYLSPPTLAAK